MPTWSSMSAFSADLSKLARELEREEARRITREMAEKAQRIATAAASADLGGDPKFSGWAPVLDTQIKSGRDSSHLLTPTRTGAGPWTVAEQGRNRGKVGGRLAGPSLGGPRSVRGVRRARGRRWNGYTQGKGTASDAVARMERELPPIAERQVRRVIVKRFDVT
jgi:hypothetical protein